MTEPPATPAAYWQLSAPFGETRHRLAITPAVQVPDDPEAEAALALAVMAVRGAMLAPDHDYGAHYRADVTRPDGTPASIMLGDPRVRLLYRLLGGHLHPLTGTPEEGAALACTDLRPDAQRAALDTLRGALTPTEDA